MNGASGLTLGLGGLCKLALPDIEVLFEDRASARGQRAGFMTERGGAVGQKTAKHNPYCDLLPKGGNL